MKKIFTILGVFAVMFFASYGLISCSSPGDSLEETHYTYNVSSAKVAFNNAVVSLNEEFLINRAITERQGSIKSDFLGLIQSQIIVAVMCCMAGILYTSIMGL